MGLKANLPRRRCEWYSLSRIHQKKNVSGELFCWRPLDSCRIVFGIQGIVSYLFPQTHKFMYTAGIPHYHSQIEMNIGFVMYFDYFSNIQILNAYAIGA